MSTEKPAKPYPDFPLFYHQSGQWAKKIRGRTHYFGTDAEAALAAYLKVRDDLQAGRTPRDPDGITLKRLANLFLTSKQTLLDAGELSPRTWRDYSATCERLLGLLGGGRHLDTLAPADFERVRASLAETRGPVSLGNEIQRVRTLFRFALDDGHLDQPVRFGTAFRKPSAKAVRQAKHDGGGRMLEAADLRRLIRLAGVPMRAMILLGVNCGFGQSDLAALPLSAIDLGGKVIDYPRPKTAIARRCPLWPETVKAIREVISQRPEPVNEADGGLLFLTRFGRRWVRAREREGGAAAVPIDSIGLEFHKLLVESGLKRKGLGFYALRHVFRTVADEVKDQPAVNHIMGHADGSMASHYRERIGDDRLRAVADHVRGWIFPGQSSDRSARKRAPKT